METTGCCKPGLVPINQYWILRHTACNTVATSAERIKTAASKTPWIGMSAMVHSVRLGTGGVWRRFYYFYGSAVATRRYAMNLAHVVCTFCNEDTYEMGEWNSVTARPGVGPFGTRLAVHVLWYILYVQHQLDHDPWITLLEGTTVGTRAWRQTKDK